ncbi:TonB-dependent receptor [Spirosoma montaniterrae]|uniref:TonB-dependent receptor n=1 Tax=Spirosoma montaniterrae TaxID=1178516 RepID=A0A1P9WV57_9BACT|nr:TonB-dependent receptor [Spirosoma montaniterrae]AQG79264.1 TonB-dependent receptor [Spirosoma montaniterrae]
MQNGWLKRGIAVGLCLWASAAIHAQTPCSTVLTGQILAQTTRQPLPGATVYVRELSIGAVADTTGTFRLSTLCRGKYTLVYQSIGYKPIEQIVTIQTDLAQIVSPAQLRPDSQTLQEITVTEHRSEAKQLLQTQAELSGHALDASRGLSLGESLKTLPGLYSVQTGPSISKPVIHGLYSNRILTLNNGVRQEDQQWGSEHAPMIDPFLASRITVIKGAASIRYGSDAIGGVILVEPKPMPTTPGLGGEINVVGGTNGRQGTASALLEQAVGGNLTGLSWRVQSTLKRVGYARTPNYFLENSSYHETNFSGAVAYTRSLRTGGTAGIDLFYSQFNTKVGLFTGAQVGSLSDFYAAIARPEPLRQPGFSYALDRPYQHVQHGLLRLRAFLRSDRLGNLTFTYGRQQNVRREYDFLSFSRVTDPELYLKLVTQTADLIWEQKPVKTANGGQFSGSVGANGITQGNVRKFLFLIPNYRNYGAGLFALQRYAYNNWTVEGGIRYDYRWLRAFFLDEITNAVTNTTRQWQNLTGSFGVTYQLSPQLTITGNLGTAWRAPNVNDLYSNGLHQSAVAYERGNPNLQPEQARNLNLSVEYTGKRLYADLTLYNNWINNYIYLKPDSVPIVRQRGAFPSFTYNQVRATFRGIDATLRYKLAEGLTLVSKTSLLFAYDHTNRDYLVYIPPNRTDNGLRYTLPDRGRFSGMYVSVSSQYVSRQNRVPTVTQREEGGRIIFTGDFAPPPPAYTLFGAELGFRSRIGRQPISLILTGTNLLNRAYRDYLDRFRYFADEPGRNVMLKLKLPLSFGQNRTELVWNDSES